MQEEAYFEFTRTEIGSLLPDKADRILEVGCGMGNTLAWLKQRFPNAETVGVEYWQEAHDQLSKNADVAIIADLEAGLPEGLAGPFDLILALDVLEHLRDPGRVLASLAGLLSPRGQVIVSLPNVSHVSVSLPLVLQRRFRHTDAGIMDRTHLRWFTEENALALLNGAGLQVTDAVINGVDGPKTRLFDAVTLGVFRHWLTKQYVMRGEPGSGQPPVKWRIP